MANSVTRPGRAWSAAMAVALAVGACQGAASPSAIPSTAGASSAPGGSAAASPSAAAQPYAGQTVTLETYASVPEFDFYATLMPQFQQQTGITVNYVQQPVAAQDQKIPLQLTAKDDSLDVFFTGSENIGHYVGISGVEPLDAYINDTAQYIGSPWSL